MALETERCSPNNASSPGPTDNNRRPGLDDCSDQTKEVSSPHIRRKTPPPSLQLSATTASAVSDDDDDGDGDGSQPLPPPMTGTSAFRPVREDIADDDHRRTTDDTSALLACSKPLSICSPLQNKTTVMSDCSRLQTSPPPPPPHLANRKKSVQKPAPAAVAAAAVTASPCVDVPRWVQQQQLQHVALQQQQQDQAAAPPTAAAAAAAVEYTMAVAAAAAVAGHVPPVFPFNSWMYRFNFLPMVPAAAAEYFREMHHYHQQNNNVGSSETDELRQPAAIHHPHLPLSHQQQQHVEFARLQQQQQQQTVPSKVPPHHYLPPPPQPLSVPARTTGGYDVSRPASTSGSSDVSSSCGGGMMMATVATGGLTTATKNYCRSPSPRSPSPFQLAFSVDNILRPEFGSKLHHHHQILQQHHHHHNSNSRTRPSTASPPSPVQTAAKLHYNFVSNKTSPQQQSTRLLPHASPSLVQTAAQPPPSLLRPAPTRPNAAAMAVLPKRPASVVAAMQATADKAKRKPPPLPRSCSPVNSAPAGHRLKSDDSGKNNNNIVNEEDQESDATTGTGDQQSSEKELWPAWVYCTRYSDRPSSGKC